LNVNQDLVGKTISGVIASMGQHASFSTPQPFAVARGAASRPTPMLAQSAITTLRNTADFPRAFRMVAVPSCQFTTARPGATNRQAARALDSDARRVL
jgi:hypothetical protein